MSFNGCYCVGQNEAGGVYATGTVGDSELSAGPVAATAPGVEIAAYVGQGASRCRRRALIEEVVISDADQISQIGAGKVQKCPPWR